MTEKKIRVYVRSVDYGVDGEVDKIEIRFVNTGAIYENVVKFNSKEKYQEFYRATKDAIKWINPTVV